MKSRPFFAARIEDRLNKVVNKILLRFGWQEHVNPFIGFGTTEQIRVLARVVLQPPSRSGLVQAAGELLHRRGWRNFIAAARVNAETYVVIGDQRIPLHADRGGYINARFRNPGLQPGWHQVRIETSRGGSAIADVQVIDSQETFGIVSDVDDTILSTYLPRPLLAAWNSFILTEGRRQAVEGMARMFQQLLKEHPGAPVIYVSTGAWNTFPMITRFMSRHGFPRGALLLTDWGPTNTGWFRKGADHKRTTLRELARDLPNIQWVLVGDDGQHDPELYAEFAELQPQHVRARAIRQLSPGEMALSRGLPTQPPTDYYWTPDAAPEVRAPDGDALGDKLREII